MVVTMRVRVALLMRGLLRRLALLGVLLGVCVRMVMMVSARGGASSSLLRFQLRGPSLQAVFHGGRGRSWWRHARKNTTHLPVAVERHGHRGSLRSMVIRVRVVMRRTLHFLQCQQRVLHFRSLILRSHGCREIFIGGDGVGQGRHASLPGLIGGILASTRANTGIHGSRPQQGTQRTAAGRATARGRQSIVAASTTQGRTATSGADARVSIALAGGGTGPPTVASAAAGATAAPHAHVHVTVTVTMGAVARAGPAAVSAPSSPTAATTTTGRTRAHIAPSSSAAGAVS